MRPTPSLLATSWLGLAAALVPSAPRLPPRSPPLASLSSSLSSPPRPYDSTYPQQYVAYKTSDLSPTSLDGDLSKSVWADVAWTTSFVDISTTTAPRLSTQVKMRYDEQYLYVAAYLEEPDVWATLTEHDSVIFNDNDFEIFVDPNATTHFYKEYEMNAFNTTWDLCLNKPYSDGGYENSSRVYGDEGWDMQPPLRSAVAVHGPLNDPSTPSEGWSVEVALPLRELMYNNTDEVSGRRASPTVTSF